MNIIVGPFVVCVRKQYIIDKRKPIALSFKRYHEHHTWKTENQNVHKVVRVRRSEICVYLASKGDPHETVALEQTFFHKQQTVSKRRKYCLTPPLKMSPDWPPPKVPRLAPP